MIHPSMGMGAARLILFSDILLVPSSLFLTIGYHAYLRHCLRHKPRLTTIGANSSIETTRWLRHLITLGDDKHGMLAVQTLRNTFMAAILTALLTLTISLSLAALVNNTYTAVAHLTTTTGILPSILGLQIQPPLNIITTLKFGSAYISLLTSFLSSSMGISYLMDANFLINANAGIQEDNTHTHTHTHTITERGFTLVVVGNRVLCISFTLLLWMLGPVPMLISSVVLIWALYQLDFHAPVGHA